MIWVRELSCACRVDDPIILLPCADTVGRSDLSMVDLSCRTCRDRSGGRDDVYFYFTTIPTALSSALAVVAILIAGIAGTGTASAQTPGILPPGDAIVTGFSGAPPPAQVAPGQDPGDLTFIDPSGPAARVFDLQSPGAPPQAQVLPEPNPFTVTAAQVGQVFGVALDNATPPNMYVAATSAYGLPIVVPGQGGAPIMCIRARRARALWRDYSDRPRKAAARIDLADRRRHRRRRACSSTSRSTALRTRVRRSAGSPLMLPPIRCSSPTARPE